MQVEQITSLTTQTPEDEIAAAIDFVKQFPVYNRLLIQYFPLQHALYSSRSANEVIRIRGYMFESFGHCGLPDEALPFVLEVLESERSAYLVAGAAIALHGLSEVKPEIASYLLKAIHNIKFSDDAISFDAYRPRWPLPKHTTGLLEICKALQWMGAHAIESISHLKELCEDEFVNNRVKAAIKETIAVIERAADDDHQACCCRIASAFVNSSANRTQNELTSDVQELILEDQLGARCKYKEYFQGRPAIVVFFYTRCDNPNKCSLMITRLAQLQKALITEGLETRAKIAAITYDPVYDRPFRLKAYCENRGVVLNDDHRAFRIESGMPNLLRYFNSGVNYIGSIVNHHTTELFIIDKDGNICTHFQQLRWQIAEVIARLKECLNDGAYDKRKDLYGTRHAITSFLSPVLSFLIVISPKCPFCWAGYLSAVGITNIQLLRSTHWLLPGFWLLVCMNLFSLCQRTTGRNGLLPCYLSLSGILCVAFFVFVEQARVMGYAGIVLVLMGSVLSSLDRRAFAAFAQSGLARVKSSLGRRA
jgi:protein SCO1